MNEITDLEDVLEVQADAKIQVKECEHTVNRAKKNLDKAKDLERRINRIVAKIKKQVGSK